MKIECWNIGKTADRYLDEGIQKYAGKLPHSLPFEWVILPDIRQAGKLKPEQLKQKEAESILKDRIEEMIRASKDPNLQYEMD